MDKPNKTGALEMSENGKQNSSASKTGSEAEDAVARRQNAHGPGCGCQGCRTEQYLITTTLH